MKEKTGTPQPSPIVKCDADLRRIVAEIISQCHMKRPEIAESIEDITDQHTTAYMLDCFTAESKAAARFPAFFIAPFSEVVRDDRLQRLVMGPRLLSLVEYAERELRAAEDERERLALRNRLIEQKVKR
jgi:hypothetical protein